MRLLELQLLAYGPFTDCVLDLSAGQEGLHFVFGPNEAGKSSALRAIHGLLYGIPAKCTDDQLHNKKSLRIGAVIKNAAKKKMRFHRRKGRKDTILNPKVKKGGAYPDDSLDPFLCGIDAETFDRVYGIGHEELQRGGREMQLLRGLVGESLFAATVGGAGLAELLASLDDEAAELYDAKKRNVRVKTAKRDFDALKKQRRESQLSKSRWEKLQAELGKANKRRDEVVQLESNLERERHKLERFQNSLSLIVRRDNLQSELEELGETVILPEHYSVGARGAIETEGKQLAQLIDRLEVKLNGEDSLQQRLAAIEVPTGLIEFSESIAELKDHRAVIVKARHDHASLQRDCENLRMEVESALRDLGLGRSFDEAEKFRISPDRRTHIQTLGTDEKQLRNRPVEIRTEKKEQELEQQSLQEKLDKLGTPLDVAHLSQTVDRLQKQGDDQKELHELRQNVERAASEAGHALATLGLWTGSLEELTVLRMPLPETVDRFSDEFYEIRERIGASETDRKRLNEEISVEQQAINALHQEGHVPTEHELEQLREHRDSLWRELRSFVQSRSEHGTSDVVETLAKAGDGQDRHGRFPMLADRFAESVANVDVVADRLRREADRVAQLADRATRVSELKRQVVENERKAKDLDARLSEWDTQWRLEWQACGVLSPLAPREMQSWLAKLRAAQQSSQVLGGLKAELQHFEKRYQASCQQVTDCLAALDQFVPRTDSPSLDQLLDHAESILSQHRDGEQQRLAIENDLKRSRQTLEALNVEEVQACEALKNWQEKWVEAMKHLGADATTTADQANERLNCLTRLFRHVRDIESKQKRIADIDKDTEAFHVSVKRLAKRFLADVDSVPAEDAVLELVALLERARRDQELYDRLIVEVEETREELEEAEKKQVSVTQRLNDLCQLAGVQDAAALPDVERSSYLRAECQQGLVQVEEQLLELCGGKSVEDFVAQAREWNADDLHVRINTLERELSEIKQQRDAAVVAVRDLEAEAREADGRSDAAECDQAALGLITRMQSDAGKYMRLRMAATMLRQQIEKHRAENEDPLLQRASTLFSRMTCEEYSGIRTDFEDDQPIIVGVRRSNETLVPVQAMSDGTRDQLYLALRLGYVERQLVEYEPMPFIVDDILVHYDDQRSQATLGVLAELAKQTQVIFFTHHWHLVELAKDSLSPEECFVHQLDSRERETSPRMASSRPR